MFMSTQRLHGSSYIKQSLSNLNPASLKETMPIFSICVADTPMYKLQDSSLTLSNGECQMITRIDSSSKYVGGKINTTRILQYFVTTSLYAYNCPALDFLICFPTTKLIGQLWPITPGRFNILLQDRQGGQATGMKDSLE